MSKIYETLYGIPKNSGDSSASYYIDMIRHAEKGSEEFSDGCDAIELAFRRLRALEIFIEGHTARGLLSCHDENGEQRSRDIFLGISECLNAMVEKLNYNQYKGQTKNLVKYFEEVR